MKADRSNFRGSYGLCKACLAFQALLLICASLIARGLFAQSATSSTSSPSDPNALAIVANALTAMGGAANWQAIGAATTEVSVSRAGVATRTVQWSDDWHLGYVLSRRDLSTANGHKLTTISLKDHRILSSNGGKGRTIPRENDLAVLAAGDPGAALALSLKRKGCVFQVLSNSTSPNATSDAGDKTIEEDCRDPLFPTTAHLTWTFSASTELPTRVRLPVRLLLHSGVAYETVKFGQFVSQQNVLVPSKVSLVLPSGQSDELQFGPRSLISSLPDSTFTIP